MKYGCDASADVDCAGEYFAGANHGRDGHRVIGVRPIGHVIRRTSGSWRWRFEALGIVGGRTLLDAR